MYTENHRTMKTPGKFLVDADCLSTDQKPTEGICNGSQIKELDTAKLYFFDEEHKQWEEWT